MLSCAQQPDRKIVLKTSQKKKNNNTVKYLKNTGDMLIKTNL